MLTGSLIGISLPLAKLASMHGWSPVAYAMWQALGGTLIVGLGLALTGRVRLTLTAHALRYYGICGLVSFAIPNLLQFAAVPHVGAGLTAVIVSPTPILTWLISRAVGRESGDTLKLAGLSVGLVGVLAILGPSAALPDPQAAVWALVLILVPMVLAAGNVYRSLDWPAEVTIPMAAVGMLGAAAGFLTAATVASGALQSPLPVRTAGDWAVLAQMPIAGLAYLTYFRLQQVGGPVYLSQMGYLIIVAGMVPGIVVFGERYGAWVWLGVALIGLGVFLVNARTVFAQRGPGS